MNKGVEVQLQLALGRGEAESLVNQKMQSLT